MPRKKVVKVDEPEVIEEVIPSAVVEAVPAEINSFVKVVEINGKKYNEIFDPSDGTTRLELIS